LLHSWLHIIMVYGMDVARRRTGSTRTRSKNTFHDVALSQDERHRHHHASSMDLPRMNSTNCVVAVFFHPFSHVFPYCKILHTHASNACVALTHFRIIQGKRQNHIIRQYDRKSSCRMQRLQPAHHGAVFRFLSPFSKDCVKSLQSTSRPALGPTDSRSRQANSIGSICPMWACQPLIL